jgi:hypothetical protein
MIAKSTVIKDRGGKSGGRAVKAVDLTSGGLRCVSATRLRSPREIAALTGLFHRLGLRRRAAAYYALC